MALEDTASAAAVDKAYHYLAETDEEYSQLYAQAQTIGDWVKVEKANQFLMSGLSGVKEREMEADCCPAVTARIEDREAILERLELLKVKRNRAHVLIDLYRTVEASRRRA